MARPSPRAKALLRWYAASARDLPWRSDPSPYHVWVSEIMLQQTRVEAVREKYTAFLRRFPTLAALARANEQAVLQAWSGLGYYRRARMLHAAAREVADRHGGEFPADLAAIAELPGIGRYTAGAIASIAFNQPAPIVDGNIERVFARWHGIKGDIKGRANQQRLWQLAHQWVTQGRAAGHQPRDLNQALMELGALVCTPRSPRCAQCPVARHCTARKAGDPEAFPKSARRAAPQDVRLWFAALFDGKGRVWMVRREPGGRQSLLPDGLWELPHADWPRDTTAPMAAIGKLIACTLAANGPLFTRKHSIMRWRVELAAQQVAALRPPAWPHGPARWFTPKAALAAAQASATTKLLRALFASRH